MLNRSRYLEMLGNAVRRSPVTALLGPTQSGKTALARQFADGRPSTRFDLRSEADLRRLTNPQLMLGALNGLVVLDEIQLRPDLLSELRALLSRSDRAHFLVLGTTSADVLRAASGSLADRIEFVELGGFDISESGVTDWTRLWVRGGLPHAFLAASNEESLDWRSNLVRAFLERDAAQLGLRVPATVMRRFWTTLAHSHGQTWNGAALARAMSLSDKTVRKYLDFLTSTYMVRQLPPWFEKLRKRQVKAPRIYFRDSGLLHALLDIPDQLTLFGSPRAGASWEGFAIEQVLRTLEPRDAWFWKAHSGGEIGLLVQHGARRIGFEMQFSEAPKITKWTRDAANTLALDHLFVICPVQDFWPVSEQITVLPITEVSGLRERVADLPKAGAGRGIRARGGRAD